MSRPWHGPRIPPPEDCVLRALVDRRARETPARVFAHFAASGAEWTYAELRRIVVETAAALQRLGVAPGDPVHVWLPNGPDALRLWSAINYLGAVYVPLNLAWRGRILEHAVRTSGVRLILGHTELLVPRYVRIVPVLPRTPTQKVRVDGVTADTWDREAAGIRVRRERLSSRNTVQSS